MSRYFLECLHLVRLLRAKFRKAFVAGLGSDVTLQWTCGWVATKYLYLAQVYVLLAEHNGLVSRPHSKQGQPQKLAEYPCVLNTYQEEGEQRFQPISGTICKHLYTRKNLEVSVPELQWRVESPWKLADIFVLPGWPSATHSTRQGNLKALSKELMLPGTEVSPIFVPWLYCTPSTLCADDQHEKRADSWLCSLPSLAIHTPDTHGNIILSSSPSLSYDRP